MVHLTACKYQSNKAFKVHNFLFPIIIIIINIIIKIMLSSVQLLSRVWLFETPWTTGARPPCLSPTLGVYSNSCLLNRWCHPTISISAVLFPSSSHLQFSPASGVFSNESVLHIRWPKDWSFSFSISPSNEYSGLISFRMDWLDLLAVQGSLKSSPTPQFKSINSSAFSFAYSPTLTSLHDYWKTIALTRWTFVGKVMSLLFNMLFRFVIAFLPRNKCPLI